MAGILRAAPPIASRQTTITNKIYGVNVSDAYAWLRDDSRSNVDVLAYLQAENQYANVYLKQLQPLVDSLADSMDAAVPAVEVSHVSRCRAHLELL
ncbi:hypothetical protein COO60DRAFT_341811 [Scenedesmus sp. NREL 46B-D3]|nr:hypothetical protein COO60DRAFT_341811 [Scenedesmus sp. NREL 46B-D3]